MKRTKLSMLSRVVGIGLALVLLFTDTARAQTATPANPVPIPSDRKTPAYILIKVDDLRHLRGAVPPRWQRLADLLKQRKIKSGFGIICDSLEGDNPAYFRWIKEQKAVGLIEFWNHGYSHREWTENGKKRQEFSGATYEQQKESLTRSQRLAREKLGFTFPTFGAPFNATDATTVKILEEDSETKIWLYGDRKNPAGKMVLDRVGPVNIENPIFKPSLAKFIEGYNRHPNRAYFVIQGHPGTWDDAGFEQFTAILDFLTKEKAIFTTPSEYAKINAAAPSGR